jgi:hypothetical protein
MRPLFAIAPLALAFALLGPTTTEASPAAGQALMVKVWHMVFDHGSAPASSKPQADSLTEAAALNH